jgi:hypothetical protein
MPRPVGPSVRAADFQVQGVPTQAEAVRFLRLHHYARGASNSSTYRHGLYRADPAVAPLVGELVGVALWIPPTREAAMTVAGDAWRGVLALSRLAVAPGLGTNGASLLLGRSMRLIDRERWPWLLTYADTGCGHTGGIYRATNWTFLGEVAAADTWLSADGTQRGRKRGSSPTMTAGQMVDAGYTRRPNMGKLKIVHHQPARRALTSGRTNPGR